MGHRSLTPVTWVPVEPSFGTIPVATGSVTDEKTIGMLFDTFTEAWALGVLMA